MQTTEVVITGVGVVSPIGIGREAFWEALLAGHCGIGPVTQTNMAGMPPQLAGEVRNFDARTFVANRKSLKVMSRDAQLGIAASTLACRDAGISAGKIDPERFGVVLGADQICSPIQESETTYGACIVGRPVRFSALGHQGHGGQFSVGIPAGPAEYGGLARFHRPGRPGTEQHHSRRRDFQPAGGDRVGQRHSAGNGRRDARRRGQFADAPPGFRAADGHGKFSPRHDDPAAVVRPFDARRDGYVWSEGAAVLVLESRGHAESRGAKVLARLKGWGAAFEAVNSRGRLSGSGLRRAIAAALEHAAVKPDALGTSRPTD